MNISIYTYWKLAKPWQFKQLQNTAPQELIDGNIVLSENLASRPSIIEAWDPILTSWDSIFASRNSKHSSFDDWVSSYLWAVLYLIWIFNLLYFPLKNSRGRLFFFLSHKSGGIFKGKAIISNIVHWKSYPVYFVNQKMITSNKLNMGFLSVPNVFSWSNFNTNILSVRAWSVLLDQNPLQLNREVIRGKWLMRVDYYSRKHGNIYFFKC